MKEGSSSNEDRFNILGAKLNGAVHIMILQHNAGR
jgi:hypothetical protein